jgi:hypothetical protein
MFKITILFESNEKGIYTKEEETATDEMWLKAKKERMIDRWLNILCPHLTISSVCYSLTLIQEKNMIYEYKLKLIQMYLEMINKIDNGQRTFTIIEEII